MATVSDPAASELEAKVIELALKRYALINAGKSGAANKAYDDIYKLAVHIRKQSDLGAAIARRLAKHTHSGVQVFGAYLLLPIDPNFALSVFKKIEREGQQAWERSNAEMCIKEWKAGRMNVDWFMN
jgi:hypothetical protein